MTFYVYVKGPLATSYRIAAHFNKRTDAEQYMAEFLADRPGFQAHIEMR